MESFNLLIDGKMVAASVAQLNQAVAAAKAAFPAWAATEFTQLQVINMAR